MTPPAPVGRTAILLGFAGLLPPAAAVGWAIMQDRSAWVVGLIYALSILSFLGGIWWGLAMRAGVRQAPLVAMAVVPSLLAFVLAVTSFVTFGSSWVLVATGVALLLTLPVDRWLTRTGAAPANWMRLRVPLSVGLGGLTILLGALTSGPVTPSDTSTPAIARAEPTVAPIFPPASDYVGRWTGVEGMFLDVAATDRPDRYRLTMQYDLDHRRTVTAKLDNDRLVFTSEGSSHSLVPTDGVATGLKYLAGKKDCLTVVPGEGYCRD